MMHDVPGQFAFASAYADAEPAKALALLLTCDPMRAVAFSYSARKANGSYSISSKPRPRSSDNSLLVQQHIVRVARHPQPGEICRKWLQDAFRPKARAHHPPTRTIITAFKSGTLAPCRPGRPCVHRVLLRGRLFAAVSRTAGSLSPNGLPPGLERIHARSRSSRQPARCSVSSPVKIRSPWVLQPHADALEPLR